jgi:type IV secretory pathway VirB2 component (pilin)
MKDYPIASKVGIIISIFGILIVGLNWLFGIINDHITDGVSIILLVSFLTTLYANISIAESCKRKKLNNIL